MLNEEQKEGTFPNIGNVPSSKECFLFLVAIFYMLDFVLKNVPSLLKNFKK